MENSLFFLIIVLFLTLFTSAYKACKFKTLKNQNDKLYKKLVFSLLFRFMLESYLELSVISFIAFQSKNSFKYFGEVFSHLIFFLVSFLLFTMPVFSYRFVQKNKHKLNQELIIQKYGVLYEEYEENVRSYGVLFFCLKRMVLAYVIINLESIYLQLIILILV